MFMGHLRGLFKPSSTSWSLQVSLALAAVKQDAGLRIDDSNYEVDLPPPLPRAFQNMTTKSEMKEPSAICRRPEARALP